MKSLLLASVLLAYVSSDDHVVPAEVVSVYDGDTINVRAEIWPDIYWEGAIRLNNIDTPEIGWRAECPQEAALAYEAKALMEEYARGQVLIVNPKLGKFAGRVIADIMTLDGIFLDDMLVGAGLAREYHGGRREGWCPE